MINQLEDCDTSHFLYLLQIACDLHRQWVIERNQYFASISRTDRFLNRVDVPQLITNLLIWHNEDKESHVFDAETIDDEDGYWIIRELLVQIGMFDQLLWT